MPTESVQCCVTSPPYWNLRDYKMDGQLGLERTPQEYIENMVEVFKQVKRVLKNDGTLWMNLGDSYAGNNAGGFRPGSGRGDGKIDKRGQRNRNGNGCPEGLKPKDLIGIPWRTALAMQAQGWYLRSDVIWHKPNPMPESVTDRPTKSHEYIFMMTKRAKYFYDHKAILEPIAESQHGRIRDDAVGGTSHVERGQHSKGGQYKKTSRGNKERKPRPSPPDGHAGAQAGSIPWEGETRNKRSVWTVATKPFPQAHFATFPPELIEPCILAGSRPGDLVLDPFSGAGTTGLVALRHSRNYEGIELNPEYVLMSRERIILDAPLLNRDQS